ncbi:RNase adapter RapZ [Ostreibacterium oceani]|uniref:RNase adapter RapZ n=1 Tax=Ostreibacterium oceani TaxID=2654998 RepID=A0A6N7EX34_9GAMM|nr:RNase adapter RapZ [Ostreibacterium oceani]MPV86493.1 RNase adapter RapZ [Ostreibacterium oceani]
MIIISGLSGAGKTVALHTLEDLGYYCIDNLPITLLPALYKEQQNIDVPIAVGIDIRSQTSNTKTIPQLIASFKKQDPANPARVLFLTAKNSVLIKRFSESRRKHPLSMQGITLTDAIEKEKKVLSPLLLSADYRIDTSALNIYELKSRITDWLSIANDTIPVITLESFGFKYGVPIDADLVYDVRFLPNPYWDSSLRHFNGKDEAIQTYLSQFDVTHDFANDTLAYLKKWLPTYLQSSRSYLTIAVGCTGGKHRSVFMTETLAKALRIDYPKLNLRHRDLPDH